VTRSALPAKISISNLAWPASAEREAVALARSLGFAGIEIAPAKLFGGWPADLLGRASDYRIEMADLGLQLPALQGIVFGIAGCHFFNPPEARARLVDHLTLVARLAGTVGAHACVFGAPKLRDPGALSTEAAFDAAVGLLRSVASTFADEGSALAFEPNPIAYGCRFVAGTDEAVALVAAVDHPGIRLQLDSGTIFINEESSFAIAHATALAAHVHISEPMLDPIGQNGHDHRRVGKAIAAGGYEGWLSVEMHETDDWRSAMHTAAAVVNDAYS
jgi:D-psicose/D-tagatose/L-ribulose 3-epimerase